MTRLPLWVRILTVAIVVVAIEIALLLHKGSVVFERPERWKAFILFLPFAVMLAAIGAGLWRFAERAKAGGERIFTKALAALYAGAMTLLLATITWFILFR